MFLLTPVFDYLFMPVRYCTDTKTIFTTSVMLKNHISLMHGIKNPDLGQMPKTSIKDCRKVLGKVVVQNFLNRNIKNVGRNVNYNCC